MKYSDFISKIKQACPEFNRGGDDERGTQTVQAVRQGASEEVNAVSPMKWNRN